ncbi:hypothetical protein WKJ31_004509 [Salmonella enterica]
MDEDNGQDSGGEGTVMGAAQMIQASLMMKIRQTYRVCDLLFLALTVQLKL